MQRQWTQALDQAGASTSAHHPTPLSKPPLSPRKSIDQDQKSTSRHFATHAPLSSEQGQNHREPANFSPRTEQEQGHPQLPSQSHPQPQHHQQFELPPGGAVSEPQSGWQGQGDVLVGSGERQRGMVKFFNFQKGYGFVVPDAGGPDVFVHHTAIVSAEPGFKSLADGEIVEYYMTIGPKGLQAAEVTGPGGAAVLGVTLPLWPQLGGGVPFYDYSTSGPPGSAPFMMPGQGMGDQQTYLGYPPFQGGGGGGGGGYYPNAPSYLVYPPQSYSDVVLQQQQQQQPGMLQRRSQQPPQQQPTAGYFPHHAAAAVNYPLYYQGQFQQYQQQHSPRSLSNGQ